MIKKELNQSMNSLLSSSRQVIMKVDVWKGAGLSRRGICQGTRTADVNRSALSLIEDDFPVLEEPGRKEAKGIGMGRPPLRTTMSQKLDDVKSTEGYQIQYPGN